MIEKGQLEVEVVEAIDKYAFSKQFGWTPEYIDNMDAKEKSKYKAVMMGIAEAGEQQYGSGTHG